jgi:hypothetical protein
MPFARSFEEVGKTSRSGLPRVLPFESHAWVSAHPPSITFNITFNSTRKILHTAGGTHGNEFRSD